MAWKCEIHGVYSGFGPSNTKNATKHEKEDSFEQNGVQNAIRSIKTEVWRTHVAKTREKVHILDEKRFKCEKSIKHSENVIHFSSVYNAQQVRVCLCACQIVLTKCFQHNLALEHIINLI